MITINDKEYKLKYTLRALFIFERITGKAFSIDDMMDQYLFFYCLVLASNPDTELTFDEFIDACDNDKDLVKQISDFIAKENTKQGQIDSDEGNEEKKS